MDSSLTKRRLNSSLEHLHFPRHSLNSVVQASTAAVPKLMLTRMPKKVKMQITRETEKKKEKDGHPEENSCTSPVSYGRIVADSGET